MAALIAAMWTLERSGRYSWSDLGFDVLNGMMDGMDLMFQVADFIRAPFSRTQKSGG